MELNNENKRKLISGVVTFVVHSLALLLLLVVGLPYQDPPPPEIGVEMSADDLTQAEIEDGYAGALGGGETTEEPSQSSNDDESAVTQDTDPTPLTAKNTKSKPITQPKETTPKVDNTALFQKGKVKKGGSGKGEGGGDGTSKGSGSGAGQSGEGTGNNGASFSLAGRGAKALSQPKTNKNDTGKVVVDIKVDQQGNVVEAHAGAKGTTLMDVNIWRQCEQAAKRSKFSAKEDAPELKKGSITYKFVR